MFRFRHSTSKSSGTSLKIPEMKLAFAFFLVRVGAFVVPTSRSRPTWRSKSTAAGGALAVGLALATIGEPIARDVACSSAAVVGAVA